MRIHRRWARLRAMGFAAASVAAALALAALTAGSVWADRIVTKSGQRFTGRILEETIEAVVIQTASGKVTVPQESIARIERDGDKSSGTKILPAEVDPEKAKEAFAEAQEAIRKDDWVRAGSLLEGLLRLEAEAFPQEERLAATAALVTCYLQVRDATGAATALRQRAGLVALESDKKRLVGAAEALEASGTVLVGKTEVGRFEEAMEAGCAWKALQMQEIAKQVAGAASALSAMHRLDRAAHGCLARLAEADLYVPGFSRAHRQETLAVLADNILEEARETVDVCTTDRKDLTRLWQEILDKLKKMADEARRAEEEARKAKRPLPSGSPLTIAKPDAIIRIYNQKASAYLAQRQSAEDALRNLKPFAEKYEAAELYTDREKEMTGLLEKLEELKYHDPQGGRKQEKIVLWGTGGN